MDRFAPDHTHATAEAAHTIDGFGDDMGLNDFRGDGIRHCFGADAARRSQSSGVINVRVWHVNGASHGGPRALPHMMRLVHCIECEYVSHSVHSESPDRKSDSLCRSA